VLGISWIALGLALVPDPTEGVPEEIQLTWRAPASCPDAAVVRESIAARVAELDGPRRRVAAEAVVEATLVEDEAGFELDLTINTAGAVVLRQVRSHDCALLAEATGIIVGISVDAGLGVDGIVAEMDRQAEAIGDETSGGSEVRTESDPVGEAPEPVETERFDTGRARAERPPIDAALRVAGGLDAGIIPIGGGIDVSLAVTGRGWRAEGHGSHWFSRRREFDDEPGVGGDLALWSGGLRGCYVPTFGRLEVPACTGFELGEVQASGVGGTINFNARNLWAGVVVAPGVVWLPRPWVGLFGGVDGFIALLRPGYSGQNRPVLYRSFDVAVRAMVGIELRVGGRATPP